MPPETQNPPITPTTTLPPFSPDLLPEAYRNNETFKNFKSWDDVFKSHDEARRLIGADKNTVFRIPPDGTITPDIWKKLGRPEKYEIGHGLLETMSPAARAQFLDAANAANLTAAQFETLQTALDKTGKAEVAGAQAKLQNERQAAEAAMRLQFGEAYDQNLNLAKDVLITFGHPELWDTLDKSGLAHNPGFVNVMAEIGKLLGDDKIVGGQPTTFSLTPEQASDEIAHKLADPAFSKRYFDSQAIGHAEAVKEMQRLYNAKFGGKA